MDRFERQAQEPERNLADEHTIKWVRLAANRMLDTCDAIEQFAADEKAVGDAKDWISDGDICQITLWNNSPLIVEPPNFVELEIVETDPGVKGDTASGGVKPATLSTGAVVRVPLFVDQNEIVKVDTRSREYVSRVK